MEKSQYYNFMFLITDCFTR